jgi:hypothetical protein
MSALIWGEEPGVDVDDYQLEGGVAALGTLEFDVLVEEVQEDSRRHAQRKSEKVPAGFGRRASGCGWRRTGLLAEEAYLFDAFCSDEVHETVSALGLISD